jgi:hypothetical protein
LLHILKHRIFFFCRKFQCYDTHTHTPIFRPLKIIQFLGKPKRFYTALLLNNKRFNSNGSNFIRYNISWYMTWSNQHYVLWILVKTWIVCYWILRILQGVFIHEPFIIVMNIYDIIILHDIQLRLSVYCVTLYM